MSPKEVDQFYRQVGQKIASLRRSRGSKFTQKRLADLTKGQLSRSAVANIESGRQRMALHHAVTVAKILGVEVVELFPESKKGAVVEHIDMNDPGVRNWLAKITGEQTFKKKEKEKNA